MYGGSCVRSWTGTIVGLVDEGGSGEESGTLELVK